MSQHRLVTDPARLGYRVAPGLPFLPSVTVSGRRITGLGAPRYLPSAMAEADLAEQTKAHVAQCVSGRDIARRIGPRVVGPILLLGASLVGPRVLTLVGVHGLAWAWTVLLVGVIAGAALMHLSTVLHDVEAYTGRAAAAAQFVRARTRAVSDERALDLLEDYCADMPLSERDRIYDELVDMAADPHRSWLVSGAVDHMREAIEARRRQTACDAAAAAGRILAGTACSSVQDVVPAPGRSEPVGLLLDAARERA